MKLTGPNGEEIVGEQLQFIVKNENWSEYVLSDGNTVKIRVALAEIYRTDRKDPLTGRAGYIIKSTNIVSVMEPDKKKEK
jgi:hypothetical protein